MGKFVDKSGVQHLWSEMMEYIDEHAGQGGGSSEGLSEDEVNAIINGVDLEAKYITFDISNVEKKAYRHSSGDIAGSNNAKTLCFSLTDGAKYYVYYNGSNGAWSDSTSTLLQGSNVYASTTTSGTAASTISGGTNGFILASVSCSIDGTTTLLEAGKTFSQLGYSAMYSQNTYDSSQNETASTYSVLNSQPIATGTYYTTCNDVVFDPSVLDMSKSITFDHEETGDEVTAYYYPDYEVGDVFVWFATTNGDLYCMSGFAQNTGGGGGSN